MDMNISVNTKPKEYKQTEDVEVPLKEYSWNDKELQAFKRTILNENVRCRTDDIFLLSFLRSRKYHKDKALTLLKNYYNTRRQFKDVYTDLNPSALSSALDTKMLNILPRRKTTDPIIGAWRYSHWDPSTINIRDILRCSLLLMDLELNDHQIQVNGFVLLIDARTMQWRHFLQLTPRMLYICVTSLFQVLPVSYKAIHVVNVNKLFRAILVILFPMLPYKLRQRFHIHGSNMENLHKHLDPKYLPSEFGGDLPPFDPSEYNQKIRENEDWYKENEKYWTENERY